MQFRTSQNAPKKFQKLYKNALFLNCIESDSKVIICVRKVKQIPNTCFLLITSFDPDLLKTYFE